MSFLDSPIYDQAQREHDDPPEWNEEEEVDEYGPELGWEEE